MSILYKSRSRRDAERYIERHSYYGLVRITLIGCNWAVIVKA